MLMMMMNCPRRLRQGFGVALRPFSHLEGYMYRWVLCRAGRFMARIHQIVDVDRTPFLHSHPFWYLSVIISGGYDERVLRADGTLGVVRRRRGSVVLRHPGTLHRIDRVVGPCTTLFIIWSLPTQLGQGWRLARHPEVLVPIGYDERPDGIYASPGGGFRKRSGGVWFAKRPTVEAAIACDRISLHQARLE